MASKKKNRLAALFDTRRPDLRAPAAVWNAIRGADTEFYPRLPVDPADPVEARTPGSREILDTAQAAFDAINFARVDNDGRKALRERYRESLNEAKSQTEYQDAKAARLLTILSIFLAISGMMFAKFVDFYPLWMQAQSWPTALVVAAYLVFAAFLLLVVSGAIVIFHASRTRFRYDASARIAGTKVGSRLFYMPISRVTPEAWIGEVAAFASVGESAAAAADQMFLRDLAVEAYLVACKTADKVRYLQPAQDLLWTATRIFFVWILLVATIIALVPRWKETKAPPAPPPVFQILTQSPATVPPVPSAPRAEATK